MADEKKEEKKDDKPKDGLDVSKITTISDLEDLISLGGHKNDTLNATQVAIYNRMVELLQTGDDYGYFARSKAESAMRYIPRAHEMFGKMNVALMVARKR